VREAGTYVTWGGYNPEMLPMEISASTRRCYSQYKANKNLNQNHRIK
jgi:hypothetical protein